MDESKSALTEKLRNILPKSPIKGDIVRVKFLGHQTKAQIGSKSRSLKGLKVEKRIEISGKKWRAMNIEIVLLEKKNWTSSGLILAEIQCYKWCVGGPKVFYGLQKHCSFVKHNTKVFHNNHKSSEKVNQIQSKFKAVK